MKRITNMKYKYNAIHKCKANREKRLQNMIYSCLKIYLYSPF